MSAGAAPSQRTLEQAAEWFALLRSQAVDSDRAAWQAWLKQRAEHRDAWRQIETISQRFQPLRMAGEPAADALRALTARRGERRRLLGKLGLLMGAGSLGWASWRHAGLPEWVAAGLADLGTGTGEIRQVVLADGSRLWLNSASAVDVAFGPELRRLALLRGEILVETRHDPAQPFAVDTPQGRVTASRASRFSVRRQEGASQVCVFAGAVGVRTGSGADCLLAAGRQLRFTAGSAGVHGPARVGREAWIRGLLLADDMPLGEVAAELAGHFRGHIGVAPEVAGLRVLGGYPLEDPPRALAMLAEVLPIRIHRRLDWWIGVSAKA